MKLSSLLFARARQGFNNYNNLWETRGPVSAPLQNGVGRYIPQLKRVTFFFTKDKIDSAGVRQVIQNNLVDFANKNPGIVIYLMPKRNKAPFLVGEYLNGREARINVKNFSRSDVLAFLNYLRTRSGQSIIKHDKMWLTLTPSVQGIWNPFTHRPTELGVAQLPSEEYSKMIEEDGNKLATDRILEMVQSHNIRVIDRVDSEERLGRRLRSCGSSMTSS